MGRRRDGVATAGEGNDMPRRTHHCLNHQGIPAATHCAQCHKPICRDCIVAEEGKAAFCSVECLAGYHRFHQRYRVPGADRFVWLKKAAGIALLVGIAVGLLYAGRLLGLDICDRILQYVGL